MYKLQDTRAAAAAAVLKKLLLLLLRQVLRDMQLYTELQLLLLTLPV